jgi:hypothetical protein
MLNEIFVPPVPETFDCLKKSTSNTVGRFHPDTPLMHAEPQTENMLNFGRVLRCSFQWLDFFFFAVS